MKKIVIIAIAIIILIITGCKKDTTTTISPGSIYGTVTDKSTGDCVATAGVELMPKGLKTVTGSDGSFQFTQIDPGDYNLFITKTGYKDLKSNTITVKSGETAKGDVQIEKLPASLQIMDNNGQPVTELNFGGDAGIISKTFKIYNKGIESFSFSIEKYVDWIENPIPASGTVPVNGNCPVVLKINRDKLVDGLNTSSIIIKSETVGGVELIVKASKNPSLSILNSNGSEITELNFGSDETSIQKTFKLHNNTNQNVSFTITNTAAWIDNINPLSNVLTPNSSSTITVHIIRDLLSNGDNSTILLITTPNKGNYELIVKAKKVTNSLVIELPSANLMVQKIDLGCMNWNAAQTACQNSHIAEYNDWRLPTQAELMILYQNKPIIGGFEDEYYWSSSSADYNEYYMINFDDGSNSYHSIYYQHYVRAVRTINGTPQATPTVTTAEPSNITTNSALCGGNVTDNGGADVTERGICWSLSPNPNINNTIIECGTGIGPFTCNMTDLTNNTKYYIKAYAKNSQGTAYGDEVTFTTEIFPTFQYGGNTYQVAPDPGNSMSWVNADSYCNNLTLHGLSGWRLPTLDELIQMYAERNSIGGFSSYASYCSYWSSTSCEGNNHNKVNFYYSGSIDCDDYDHLVRPIRPINGSTPTIPSVSTIDPSNITANSATCGGNITESGGATITARGVCWSTTNHNPTTSDYHTTDGTGAGTFTSNITGLTGSTTYYVRAYATNSAGTAYGDPIGFITSGSGGSSGSDFLETFDNGIPANWATIDADGDGYSFELGTEPEFSGYNGGNCVISASYINEIGALTPDNYLVTPLMHIVDGSVFGFFACAQDSNYPTEHFGVAISFTSQTDASTFTTIIEGDLQAKKISNAKERGLNEQGAWYFCHVDLSSYAGSNIYIAIRHFNCTDQFYLDIDNVGLHINK